MHAKADDIVVTCPAERERLRPDTGAEMYDVAAEPGCEERLNAGYVDDHCPHSSIVRPNAKSVSEESGKCLTT